MEYMVLVKLYVPEIESSFEMYIPVNKTVSQVLVLMNKVVNDVTIGSYPRKQNLELLNRRNNIKYSNEQVIRDTDIKNGTELIML